MRIISLILLALIAVSCTQEKKTAQNLSNLAGGTLRYNESEKYSTLFPPSAKDIVSTHIINQVHLGLVKYDVHNLSVLPGIAKDWDQDNSGTVYTFKLNTSAKFHDDECFENGEGRKITAQDFKYTFEYLSTQSENNKNFFGTVDKIVGAKEFYQASVRENPLKNIKGIEVINDSTLQLTIEKPYDLFIYHLANPSAAVLAKEAIEAYGNKLTVGAGPFRIDKESIKTDELRLVKNDDFFMIDNKGKALPYLDSITISFVASPKKELRLFAEGNLDLVLNINNEYINEFLDDHITKFEKNPPEYILTKSERLTKESSYNLSTSSVHNFNTNKMDNLDFSIVYLNNAINTNTNK